MDWIIPNRNNKCVVSLFSIDETQNNDVKRNSIRKSLNTPTELD